MRRISLRREVLKWVQTLDLTYSVKNTKRDFCNGYLIAEMISKYDSTVHIHSYNTGTSMKNRRQNWGLLTKYFRKKSISVGDEMIEKIIMQDTESTITLVELVYELLTKKKIVSKRPVIKETVELPSFARPTLSKFLKDDGNSSKNYTYLTHKINYSLKSSERISTKRIGVSSTRRKKGKSLRHTSTVTGGKKEDVVSIREKFNNVVQNRIGAIIDLQVHRNSELAKNKDYYDFFLDLISQQKLSVQKVSEIVKSFEEVLGVHSEVMLQYPKEFWNCATLLSKAIRFVPQELPHFSTVVDLFCLLAKNLKTKDSKSAFEYLQDFVLPKLIPLIKSFPRKRKMILKVIYEFGDSDSHFEIIRMLQENLSDRKAFLNCLSFLIMYEKKFSPKLLNSYIFYCLIGFKSSRPSIRAECLSILSRIASQGYDYVFDIADKIEPLVDDDWWETQAQLIVFCSTILAFITPEKSSNNDEEKIYNIIFKVLKNCNSYVKLVSVCYLSKVVTNHKKLVPLYTESLLSLKVEHLKSLFDKSLKKNQKRELRLGTSLLNYEIWNISEEWDSIMIAKEMVKIVLHQKMDALEMKHYLILKNCLSEKKIKNNINEWEEIFKRYESYLYVGMTEERFSDISSEVIYSCYKSIGEETLKGIVYLIKTIDLVFDSSKGINSSICQENLTKLLIRLYDLGGNFRKKLGQLSKTLVERGTCKENSKLHGFVDHCK